MSRLEASPKVNALVAQQWAHLTIGSQYPPQSQYGMGGCQVGSLARTTPRGLVQTIHKICLVQTTHKVCLLQTTHSLSCTNNIKSVCLIQTTQSLSHKSSRMTSGCVVNYQECWAMELAEVMGVPKSLSKLVCMTQGLHMH